MKSLTILTTAFFSLCMTNINAQKATIVANISGFETNEGKVYVALYNSESTFLKEYEKGLIEEIAEFKSTVSFENIEDGVYAVSVFHDENGNGKLDTKMFGIPDEPVGTSNNAKGFFGPPKFEDAKFIVKGEKIELNINL